MRLLRNGRAAGPDLIEAELYKHGEPCVVGRITLILNDIFAIFFFFLLL